MLQNWTKSQETCSDSIVNSGTRHKVRHNTPQHVHCVTKFADWLGKFNRRVDIFSKWIDRNAKEQRSTIKERKKWPRSDIFQAKKCFQTKSSLLKTSNPTQMPWYVSSLKNISNSRAPMIKVEIDIFPFLRPSAVSEMPDKPSLDAKICPSNVLK